MRMGVKAGTFHRPGRPGKNFLGGWGEQQTPHKFLGKGRRFALYILEPMKIVELH